MQPHDTSLPMILNQTLDAIMPRYRELFSRYDLTEQQWRVMRVIWDNRNITSARLSELTLLSTPSLVSIIDRLEKKRLVKRARSTDDRREIYVVATKLGRELQKKVTPQVVEIQNRIQSCVTAREWKSIEKILAKIRSEMQSGSSEKRIQKN